MTIIGIDSHRDTLVCVLGGHQVQHPSRTLIQAGEVLTIGPMRTSTTGSGVGKGVLALGWDRSHPVALETGSLEHRFNREFVTRLALREKQIQQNYRPVIGIHKWFARRPGSVFRSLLLAEFAGGELTDSYWEPHALSGTIADPFMGGGTPLFEANRLGFDVVGGDVNPMACWIVRQSLAPVEADLVRAEGKRIAALVEPIVSDFYSTSCLHCGGDASAKYFLWVKTAVCPECSQQNDLFPGYRVARAGRHPLHVVACHVCGALGEFDDVPTLDSPSKCHACGASVHVEGSARRGSIVCAGCDAPFAYAQPLDGPPQHRLWAIEYYCPGCYPRVKGRQFKAPDPSDLRRVELAASMLADIERELPIPDDPILAGDESNRLHRWGYQHYREMFSTRQLLGLGLLLKSICEYTDGAVQDALLTVFSDFLRYQNMLCRYDTTALKCQDIFSVHGFPVGLIQCENNLLGIPGVGGGAFRHFVEKYALAKEYCATPFEVRRVEHRNVRVPIPGETIAADLDGTQLTGKSALLYCGPSQAVSIEPGSLDGVFTDPPYFDNVQYAELMDFCYVWLRRVLGSAHPEFLPTTTRTVGELTGNETAGRGLAAFTDGLSAVFTSFAAALKPGAPFVFTFHHNDPQAYVPLVVAILDARLTCTAVLPAAGEMAASLHIAGTSSSVVDSVFVCRRDDRMSHTDDSCRQDIRAALCSDLNSMRDAGLPQREGDARCLLAGHIAAHAIRMLASGWVRSDPLKQRMETAATQLSNIRLEVDADGIIRSLTAGDRQ